MNRKKAVQLFILLIVIIFSIGTTGFVFLEKWSVLDSFYMTAIAVSSVGFTEPGPLSEAGKVLTVFLSFGGIAVFASLFSIVAAGVFETMMLQPWRKIHMENKIKRLSKHVIICGCGDTGLWAARELYRLGQECIIIDKSDERIKAILKVIPNALVLNGDATEDSMLEKARITEARAVLVTLETDVDNLYLIMSARRFNPDLIIVAQAKDEKNEWKMLRAGATRVTLTKIVTGTQMASYIVRPQALSFIEEFLGGTDENAIRLEQLSIPDESSLIGKDLKELRIPQKTGLIILGIQEEASKKMMFNPGSEYILQPGSILVVLGREDQITKLKEYIIK